MPGKKNTPSLQMEKIIKQTPAIITVYSMATGEYKYISSGIRTILGYGDEPFLEKGVPYAFSLIHPDDIPQVQQIYTTALQSLNKSKRKRRLSEPFITFEYRIKHKDGRWKWIQTSVAVYSWDKKGKVEDIISTSVEATEWKEAAILAEKKLHESEEKYRVVVENSRDVIVALDLEGKILYASPSNERTFGFSDEETFGSFALDYVHPEDKKVMLNSLRNVTENIMKISTYRARHKDGHYSYVEGLGSLVYDEQKKPYMIVGTVRDITERHETLQRLEESEKRYRQLMEQAAEGILLVDLRLNIFDANRMICEMLGYTKDELLRLNYKDLVMKESLKALSLKQAMEELKRGVIVTIQREMRRKDGTALSVEVSANKIGKDLIQSMIRDVSERNAQQKIIEESERKYRALMEQASDAIMLFDFESNIMDTNERAVEIFGYSKAELLTMNGRNMIVDEDVKATKQALKDNLKGKTVILERKVRRKDGRIIYIESSRRLVGESDILAIMRDVTDRKQMHEAMQELNKRISEILARISDGFFSVDTTWRFTYINKAAEKILPYVADDFLGKTMWEMYPGIVGTELEKNYRIAMREQEPVSFKSAGITGKTYQVRCYPSPSGLSVYFIDISLQEELLKRQGEFISIASHELKTPLTSITLNAQLLDQIVKKTPNEKLVKLVSNLSSQAEVMREMTTHIFDTSSIQTGQLRLKKQMLDLNKLIADVVKNNQRLAINHKVTIRGKVRQRVSLDRIRISQVLTNLLTNAMKYSPNGKRVIVHIKEDLHEVVVGVQDFGIGIPKNRQRNIFGRFYRTREGKDTAGGLGLGLYISYNIIIAHGGKMWVESKAGKGSTFYFSLPLPVLKKTK